MILEAGIIGTVSAGVWSVVLVGLTGIASGFAGWLFGKKKLSAEINQMNADFYKSAFSEMQQSLDHYIKLCELNRVEISILRVTVLQMINDICKDKSCKTRRYLTPDEIEDVLKGGKYVTDTGKKQE